jgi:N-acetylglutamate synthase-like GNAT family acetyltransferase
VAVSIREARTEDAEAIARLLDQLGYPAAPGSILPRLGRLRTAGDDVVVAEVDRHVVGLAQLHLAPALEYDGEVAKLAAIVVDERCRGEGIGRSLVEAMEARARARGCLLFFLTTADRRSDAHAFYRRMGLEQTGRRFAKKLG